MALLISEAPSHGSPRGTKVLVAEDHADTRALLRMLLEKRGLWVVEAVDGFDAVKTAERERPDLILMDGGLPLLDGVAATRRLRGLPAFSAVPIVFISGHAGPQARTAALDAGCDDYVVKPFDLAQLDKVLHRHLPRDRGRYNEGGSTDAMAQTETRYHTRSGAAGPGRDGAAAPRLFGIIELDANGSVLYARIEPDGSTQSGAAPDYKGRNFYTEVAPFRNVREFRSQVEGFRRGSQPTHSIDFICDYEDGPVHVRVLLARIRERSESDTTKSILVHIRRVQ